MTKPAGVFLQIVGGMLLLCGLGLAIPEPAEGVALLAAGGWLLWAGGKPARRKT